MRRTHHQPDPEAARARHALRVVISLNLVNRRVIQQRLVAADARTDISRVLSGVALDRGRIGLAPRRRCGLRRHVRERSVQ